MKTTLGEKTFKAIHKLRKKTDLVKTLENRQLPNKHDNENGIVKQDGVRDTNCLSNTYHKVDNSQYIVHNNQSNKLKHRDVSKQTSPSNTYTKEASSEIVNRCDKIRTKTKYSPPPEIQPKSAVPTGEIVESSVTRDEHKSELDNSSVNNKNSEVPNMFRGGLKLKERLMVGLSVFAVLFTLMLVIDIQMDLGIAGKHLVPSHGKIKYVVQEEGAESAYNRFRNRLLQKTHR